MKAKNQFSADPDSILSLVSSIDRHEKAAEALFRKLVLVLEFLCSSYKRRRDNPKSPVFLRQLAVFLYEVKDEKEEADYLFQMADESEERHAQNKKTDHKLFNIFCCLTYRNLRFDVAQTQPVELLPIPERPSEENSALDSHRSKTSASGSESASISSASAVSTTDRNTILTYRQRIESST